MDAAHKPDHVVSGYRSWQAQDSQLLASWICERGPSADDRQTLLPHAEPSLVACRRGDNIDIRIFGPARVARSYAPDPEVTLYAVTLAPEALPSLTGLHADDLVDQSAALPRSSEDELAPVLARVRETGGLEALRIWDRAVRAWADPRRETNLMHIMAGRLRSRHGNMRIGDLCADHGLSERQLRRRFLDAVGLSPKQYARILRLQSLVKLADHQTGTEWAGLALDAGYCDQSHLNRECRALTGLSPVQLHAMRHGLSETSKTLPAPI